MAFVEVNVLSDGERRAACRSCAWASPWSEDLPSVVDAANDHNEVPHPTSRRWVVISGGDRPDRSAFLTAGQLHGTLCVICGGANGHMDEAGHGRDGPVFAHRRCRALNQLT